MADPVVRVASLCAGIGGLDLALTRACRGARTVVYVEREAFGAACLVAAMEEGRLDPAPVFAGDLARIDWSRWSRSVDLVAAGFPCQPFSQAGKRRGQEDERWLWPEVERAVRELGCRYVFLENVPGLTLHGLDAVLGGLASLRLNAEWTCVRASDVGAPHQRERIFILGWRCDLMGHTDSPGLEGRREPEQRSGHERPAWPPGPADADAWAAVLARWPELAPAESEIRGVADGIPARVDRLAALGNAVVPAQGAYAFRVLAERAGLTELILGDEP